jgi:hypothetical protein
MKHVIWLSAATAAVALALFALTGHGVGPLAAAQASGSGEDAVREALQPYLDGHATGRGDVMAPAFGDDARLSAVMRGQLVVRDARDYLAGMPGQPAPDEAERRRWIESVDVAGDMAVAKIILDYPQVRFVDYMVLHRVDGAWKIVHKAYQVEPR